EDLGTSEPEILDALAARRLLSYRLVWFEEKQPNEYPELAMAAVTTHDLPTIAGLWGGRDLDAQQEAGLQPNRDGWEEIREHLGRMAGVPADADVEDVIVGAHRALAGAPAVCASGTLDAAAAGGQRPD